jgi:hypothetical protein
MVGRREEETGNFTDRQSESRLLRLCSVFYLRKKHLKVENGTRPRSCRLSTPLSTLHSLAVSCQEHIHGIKFSIVIYFLNKTCTLIH